MSKSIQVQMRGGTQEEHESFIGANKEVTVDTTNYTLRVHDGSTNGGHVLSKREEVEAFKTEIKQEIEDIRNNAGQEHNHDDRYIKSIGGYTNMYNKMLYDYPGMCVDESDNEWVRTTVNGLLPYKSGGYSAIGTPTWRFLQGYFNMLDVKVGKFNEVTTDFLNVSGSVNFGSDDKITYNDTTNEYDFTSDGKTSNSKIKTGCIEIAGKRIYIGSTFPSDARVNDILIKI